MCKKELIKKIKELISLDGDEYSDGEVIDMINDLITKEENNERTNR